MCKTVLANQKRCYRTGKVSSSNPDDGRIRRQGRSRILGSAGTGSNTIATERQRPSPRVTITVTPGSATVPSGFEDGLDSQMDLIDGAAVGMSNGWTDWDEIFYVYSNGSLDDFKTQLNPVGGAAVGISLKAFPSRTMSADICVCVCVCVRYNAGLVSTIASTILYRS
ncbi:hypothetical protein EVAR_94625_1 [Eumeta japonica]|uniref:Uncharacterized protein n=1 Tax=Eumeta variegata TaxID=151549 RepID=A0A4C1UTM8_EUMVA|nr:hypothetical protein EVAR_94625_1 [Eumeta japonica]